MQLFAFLNAHLQTGLANPLDEAIVRMETKGADDYVKVDEIPYDFIRKRLTVVVEQSGGSPIMVTKGALDNVLAVCSRVQTPAGETELDDGRQAQIQEQIREVERPGLSGAGGGG